VVQLAAHNRDLSSPPAMRAAGDRYIVGTAPAEAGRPQKPL